MAPTVDLLLNWASGPAGDFSASCNLGATFPNAALRNYYANSTGTYAASQAQFVLPSTCTLANWQSNGMCAMKFSAAPFDATFGALVKKCPNSHLPFISLTCDGSGCDKIGKPCSDSSECTTSNGQLTCKQLQLPFSGNLIRAIPNVDDIYDLLDSMNLYDQADTRPGCYSADTFVSTLARKVRDYFDSNGASLTATVAQRLCIPTSFNANGVR